MPNPFQDSNTEGFLYRSSNYRRIRRRNWFIVFIGLLFSVGVLIASLQIWRAYQLETHAMAAEYVWVQLLPNENSAIRHYLVRAIMAQGAHCPVIVGEQKRLKMTVRFPRISGAFPILLCETEVEGDVVKASIGNVKLPLEMPDPNKFLIIGDTGCRIVHYETQDCNDGQVSGWPFPAIAARAAAHLTESTRSIIIHVGD